MISTVAKLNESERILKNNAREVPQQAREEMKLLIQAWEKSSSRSTDI